MAVLENNKTKKNPIEKITPEKFISQIINAYESARNLYGGNEDVRLKRGKQPSISSIAEELFAKYIASNYSK